jgi:hypothetical protein
MLLYILLAASVVAAVIVSIHKSDRYGWAIGWFALTLIFGGIASLITTGIVVSNNVHTIKYTDTETTKLTLRALGNNSAVHGQFYFLGSGYVGERQVLNFTTESSGAVKLDSMPAAQAKIFEDSDDPHLMIIKTVQTMDWAVPWELSHQMHYDFHIPKGSVLQSYKIDVNK